MQWKEIEGEREAVYVCFIGLVGQQARGIYTRSERDAMKRERERERGCMCLIHRFLLSATIGLFCQQPCTQRDPRTSGERDRGIERERRTQECWERSERVSEQVSVQARGNESVCVGVCACAHACVRVCGYVCV